MLELINASPFWLLAFTKLSSVQILYFEGCKMKHLNSTLTSFVGMYTSNTNNLDGKFFLANSSVGGLISRNSIFLYLFMQVIVS